MSEYAAGRVLNGRYALQSILGGGGMAQVFRARDTVLGRMVAIKVLREQYSQDPNFVQRFKREAQSAANLAHPNIASIYDVGEDQGLHYIVMELVPGETLRDLISRDAPLPPDRAVEIGAQMLSALEYAHHNGLVHRDVKPGNVLITPQGGVKVVDFGIAKGATDLSLTGAGLALGTAAYFSPEQAKGERVLPQSDIYAVGVTLYEMLTGRVPFQSDTDVGLAYKHISERPTPPRQLNPSIPPQLERIVLRALAKDPALRFTSALEMEQALRGYAAFGAQRTAAMPMVVPPQPQPQTAPPRRYATQTAAPVVQPARNTRGVQVNTGFGSSAAMTWILGLVALLLLVGGAALALNIPGLLNPSPTATPEGLPPATRTLEGVSTAEPTAAVAPTETSVPPTLTETPAPTATAGPTNTPVTVVIVPNITSMTVAAAQALVAPFGLTVEEVAQAEDPNHPAGEITLQDPEAGQPLASGGTIRVTVSLGPPSLPMPNVLNTDGAAAEQFLIGQGLRVKVEREPSAIQENAVSRQQPDPGTTVRVGDEVTIWISDGPLVTVPDLTGVAEEQAVQQLTGLGLNPSVSYIGEAEVGQAIQTVEPGQVYLSDPPFGSQLQPGADIRLFVREPEDEGSQLDSAGDN